ncbi:hypothetical protein Unana1_07505 [Umbelopsis nana]
MSLTLYEHFKSLELSFFSNLSSAQIKSLTCNGSLQVQDSRLYGEFAFLMSGLKPCLLVCFPDPELNALFTSAVLEKVLQRQSRFQILTVRRSLVSDEMDLRGCVVILDQENALASMASNMIEDQKCSRVSESTLALLLDYPGSLPSCAEELDTMLEVAYLDTARSRDNPTVVTTFAAQQKENKNVNRHFERYRDRVKELGIDLRMSIRQPQVLDVIDQSF